MAKTLLNLTMVSPVTRNLRVKTIIVGASLENERLPHHINQNYPSNEVGYKPVRKPT